MNRSVVQHLFLQELFLVRWFVIGSILSGGAALGIMPLGKIPAYAGGVLLVCVLIILNIFLVMNSIVQERKDKVLLFTLSLPISKAQYVAAKVAANAAAFLTPWIVLTVAAAIVIDVSQLPNGLLPFWMALLVYLFTYYCALLAVGLVSDSTGWHAVAITIGNISVNFLIPILLGLPSVAQHIESPTAVWTSDIVAIIVVEVAAAIVALALGFYLRSRRADSV
jgi:ABC-type transport system involved in multi-copper enzyme maturation permease subunit